MKLRKLEKNAEEQQEQENCVMWVNITRQIDLDECCNLTIPIRMLNFHRVYKKGLL